MNEPGVRRPIVALLVAVAALLGLGLGYALHSPSTPPPRAEAPLRCQSDPASAIAAEPAGAIWIGTGCYYTAGILITKPVTIDGGTFYDSVATRPIKPMIEVLKATGVTIENVTLNGANTGHGYHAKLVNQAGIDVRGSANLQVKDVAVNQTFGDGMTFGIEVDDNVTVDGFTATSVGRQGMTVAAVHTGTFSNIDIVSASEDGIDFETDTGKEPQDTNVSFDGLTAKGINIVQPLHYVRFTHTTVHGFHMATNGWVSFSGSFVCARTHPVPCVGVSSGWLTIERGTTFGYEPGTHPATEKFLQVGVHAIVTGGPTS